MPALLLLLAACTGEPPGDTALPSDTAPTEEEDDCETLEIHVDGQDPPSVGDTWTMLLKCDGAVLYGAMRVIWTPNDIATVDENVSVFQYAGDATLLLQAGSRRQTREVTILE